MSARAPKCKLQPVTAGNVQGKHSTYENMSSNDVVRHRKFSYKSTRQAKKLESLVQPDDDLSRPPRSSSCPDSNQNCEMKQDTPWSLTDVVRRRKFSHKSLCLAKKLESSVVQPDDDLSRLLRSSSCPDSNHDTTLHIDNDSLRSRKQDTPIREIFKLDSGVQYVRISKEWLNTQFVILKGGYDDGTQV